MLSFKLDKRKKKLLIRAQIVFGWKEMRTFMVEQLKSLGTWSKEGSLMFLHRAPELCPILPQFSPGPKMYHPSPARLPPPHCPLLSRVVADPSLSSQLSCLSLTLRLPLWLRGGPSSVATTTLCTILNQLYTKGEFCASY